MSEEKCISPLLDDFQLGAPICEHHGVICRPAIKENTNRKYIVKIITIPASQAQLDALLLAGAYKDPADAMEYYRKNGESILAEAELLQKLSKLDGFLPFDGWQMEPITRRRLGYEIYLVSSYKRSLEKFMSKNAFTHLEAVNLSLDLCSALSVCRDAGYMYVDLKPSNIYVSEKKEYRISDIGFLDLNSLRYASMPERYYSPYTPPELFDPMAPMNLTVDTYAVGMILYQLYNDGHLPFSGNTPKYPVPTPIHADYEMAEIIMKAIHEDPQQRWTDPKDLGKAIASYMQRNGINDIPITPFIPLDVQPQNLNDVPTNSSDSEEDINRSGESTDAIMSETDNTDEEATVSDETECSDPSAADSDSTQESTVIPPDSEGFIQDTPDTNLTFLSPKENIPSEDTAATPSYETESEETDAEETDAEETETSLSEDVMQIISKANDLISHEIPEETVFPISSDSDPFSFAMEENTDFDDEIPEDSLMEDESADEAPSKKKPTKHFADTTGRKKAKKFFARLFSLIIISALSVVGYWLYQNVYLQEIDSMKISGTQDQITVLIDTDVDESRLSVTCTNGKGKQIAGAVKGGKASFSDLEPSTQYTIRVHMTGFHKLIGSTEDSFTTEATTQILTFDAIAGSEDGSVQLSFTVDGNEPDFWNILYSAEGEDVKRETITNHSTMITGLSVGKIYTFTLDGGKNFELGGKTELQYMASKLILAEGLSVTSSNGSDVTLQWHTPGDVVVENWHVRYYDGYGFEEQLTVTDNRVLLTGLDSSENYTVEVTAAGMTQPASMSLTADPINISGFQTDEAQKTKLTVSWEFSGSAPANGWVLIYTIDGSGNQVIECNKPTAEISPLIPGATYNFTVQAADNRTVFNNKFSHLTSQAEPFADNGVILDNLSIDLIETPDEQNWTYEKLQNPDFRNTFHADESVSIVMRSSSVFYLPGFETKVMFVFRNSYGNVLPELLSEETYYWNHIWNAGDTKNGELDIPQIPAEPGQYLLELYFNGKAVAQLEFSIQE